MKYFRTYPWGVQLLLFLLMSFTFMSSVIAITFSLFTKITGFLPSQLTGITTVSPAALINATVIVQGVQNIFVFLLPAVAFAYLAHPKPAAYLGLRKPGKSNQLLLAVLVMAGAVPILLLTQELMQMIDFGASVKASQAAQQSMSQAIMKMPAFGDFIRVFVVMAMVPAIGEELFFRGVLMRFAKKRSNNMIMPVLFSAAVFSFAHPNVYGYLSIFLAGVLLAMLYNLTGSIWCGVIGHLFFNGFQIVMSYLGRSNPAIRAFVDNDTVPLFIVAIGAVIFAGALYLLWKNRTPLKPNWSDDFTKEELTQLVN
jgi:uncharacterized protein